jgi:hypothetical protein
VTSLEQELTALGTEIFPKTPDLSTAVLAQLDVAPAARRWHGRRVRIAVAIALVLVVAVGAVLAVPDARSTVLRWFGIGGVTVQVVDRLPAIPAVPLDSAAQIGEHVSLDEAQQQMPFHILRLPSDAAAGPESVYLGHFGVDEVTLLYGDTRRPRLLLTEAPGFVNVQFAGKLAAKGTRIEEIVVGGRKAIWIEGAPHAFFFIAPNGGTVTGSLRLARNTLIWQRDGAVLRLEGQITRAQALRLAARLT